MKWEKWDHQQNPDNTGKLFPALSRLAHPRSERQCHNQRILAGSWGAQLTCAQIGGSITQGCTSTIFGTAQSGGPVIWGCTVTVV
eukprot:1152015-Pelagomonas_calceolata.AAC.2